MTRDEILQQITHRFSEEIIGKCEKSDKRVYFDISVSAIVPMAQFIFKDLRARFNIASAVGSAAANGRASISTSGLIQSMESSTVW